MLEPNDIVEFMFDGWGVSKGDKARVIETDSKDADLTSGESTIYILSGLRKGTETLFPNYMLKKVSHINTKKEKRFKVGDLVTVLKPRLHKELKDKPLRFVSYLDNYFCSDVDGDYVKFDCIVNDLNGNMLFSSSSLLSYYSWAKKVEQRNIKKKKENALFMVSTLDNKVYAHNMVDGSTYEAKCNKGDVFDTKIGVYLALARAFNDKKLERFVLGESVEPEYEDVEYKVNSLKNILDELVAKSKRG